MDERLIPKLYRWIAAAWSIAAAITLGLGEPWLAVSITLGTALGAAVLATYAVAIRSVTAPGVARPSRALLRLMLLKYLVIAVLLYLVAHWNRLSAPAFCGGLALANFATAAGAVTLGMRAGFGRIRAGGRLTHQGDS